MRWVYWDPSPYDFVVPGVLGAACVFAVLVFAIGLPVPWGLGVAVLVLGGSKFIERATQIELRSAIADPEVMICGGNFWCN